MVPNYGRHPYRGWIGTDEELVQTVAATGLRAYLALPYMSGSARGKADGTIEWDFQHELGEAEHERVRHARDVRAETAVRGEQLRAARQAAQAAHRVGEIRVRDVIAAEHVCVAVTSALLARHRR